MVLVTGFNGVGYRWRQRSIGLPDHDSKRGLFVASGVRQDNAEHKFVATVAIYIADREA